jgi:ABC-type phosphate transport system permease subunit
MSIRRRRTDAVMRALLLAGAVLALVPLLLILYYLVKQGIGTWSGSFFTSDPTGSFFGDPGGIRSAILG